MKKRTHKAADAERPGFTIISALPFITESTITFDTYSGVYTDSNRINRNMQINDEQ